MKNLKQAQSQVNAIKRTMGKNSYAYREVTPKKTNHTTAIVTLILSVLIILALIGGLLILGDISFY